jgi:hypothetical protein
MIQKTTLTVFFLFFISISFSQTVTIPDANFEQSLIDLKIDSDGIINQSVLQSDVIAVTSLDVSNKKIKDLTGIEAFTALVTLICHTNELTDLDLSKNTNLFNLNCDNNYLINLNVKNGNNTTVKFGGGNYSAKNNRLFCINVDAAAQFSPFVPGTTRWIASDDEVKGFSEDCQGIDVIPFIASFPAPIIAILKDKADTNNDGKLLLSEIQAFVGEMDLSTITGITDLSFLDSFVNIEGLNLGSSSLASIDFSKFRGLKNLDLTDNNALKNIDLSKNPELKSLVTTGSNILEAIDLSSNPLLKDLILKNCPLIKALDISTVSELDSLVAKGNTLLSTITFGTQASGKKNKQRATTANTKLKTIDVSNNALTTLDVSSFPNVNKIIVNGNALTTLKVNNGNNVNITNANFDARNNNLTTITVDDAAFSTTNWTNIDSGVTYVSSALSVDSEVLSSMVKIYPNPFTNYIQLKLSSNISIKKVSLRDVTGKIINSYFPKNNEKINMSHLSKGLYLLIVETDKGKLSKKIVK